MIYLTVKLKRYSLLILIALLSGLNILPLRAQIQNLPPKEIILLIGQSNMAGRAPLLEQDLERVENAFLLDSLNQWIPLQNPLNLHSSIRKVASMQRFNLGYTLAKKMTKSPKNHSLGLVVNARGGTKIEQWIPGTHYYQEALRRSKAAQNTGGKIVAALWLQGESNLGDQDPNFENYFEKLKSIIFSLRKDLNNENLIFIASELNKDRPENEVFKQMLARLDREIPFSGVVKSKGTHTFDGTHYDNKGLKKLGKRFAKKLNKIKKTP
jgi:hypothetical protein